MAGRARGTNGDIEGAGRAAVGWPWRVLAAVVVAGRYLILLAWIAAAVAATLYLPPIAASGDINGLIPPGAPALRRPRRPRASCRGYCRRPRSWCSGPVWRTVPPR